MIFELRFAIADWFADALDRFTPGMIGWAVLGIIAALAVFVLAMAAISGWRTNFGKLVAPATDDEMARYKASVDQMKKELAGMTPSQKFDALVEKLGGFATVSQVAALEISFDQQIKDVRSYSHDRAHASAELVQGWALDAQSRAERLAALESDMKNVSRWVEAINTKLDHVLENWRNR